MYERYHIETSLVELPSTKIGKFKIIRDDKCLNCGRCINICIYNVYERDLNDSRKMAEPISHLCKNCFSCIQNCPQQALQMVKNREFENLGNKYWTPSIIYTIWNEAEDGKIPVYGAGYQGPFKGSGFDEIWTDMSEIVRPTRDGIHGREYIATAVDIGRKLSRLSDFKKFTLPNFHEIQIPMLLDTSLLSLKSLKNIILSIVKAAHQLKTFAFLEIENYFEELRPYLKSIALRLHLNKIFKMDLELLKEVKFIEIILPLKFSNLQLEKALKKIKKENQEALISLGIINPSHSEEIFKQFQEARADILSFHANNCGKSFQGNIFISKLIRQIHLDFVKRRMRDEITIIGKGGIAAAEHVPKLIICGADAVVLDLSLLVAMGCRICEICRIEYCPAELKKLDPNIGFQRIINMIGAWRDQLLEILSAMGIKDVRRLRGEVGRAMFYEEIEKESFGFIFNKNSLQNEGY
ncbi:glutamate synthase-related protein [Candidatus Aminicenantes bacterium AH-873-B07]|nr:glutamate synthase-related protein [Candidatus Aminicenantes bacterium AH-873-B07]